MSAGRRNRPRCFAAANFAVGNNPDARHVRVAGLLGFFLTLFLQQVAGYSAFEAGLTGLVPTIVMFTLSKRFGAAADRYGPRLFIGVGPLVAAVGFALMARFDDTVSFASEVVPALLVFSLGLAITVSPLTAAVLADADERNAGIASGANNAIARMAGLLATAGVGAVVAAQFAGSLEGRLADRPLSPSAPTAVASAERQTLGELPLPEAVAGDERAALAAVSRDASVRLPRCRDDRCRAAARRRADRPGRRAQPAPAGAGRALPRGAGMRRPPRGGPGPTGRWLGGRSRPASRRGSPWAARPVGRCRFRLRCHPSSAGSAPGSPRS